MCDILNTLPFHLMQDAFVLCKLLVGKKSEGINQLILDFYGGFFFLDKWLTDKFFNDLIFIRIY